MNKQDNVRANAMFAEYARGFMAKCAEAGVDPYYAGQMFVVKSAQFTNALNQAQALVPAPVAPVTAAPAPTQAPAAAAPVTAQPAPAQVKAVAKPRPKPKFRGPGTSFNTPIVGRT